MIIRGPLATYFPIWPAHTSVEKHRYAMTRSCFKEASRTSITQITVLVFMPCLSLQKSEKHSYVLLISG